MAQTREERAGSGSLDLSGAAGRIAFLEEYIGKRIAEAEVAEARLGRRMEAAAKAEEGLRGMCEALRKQVAEAGTAIAALGEFEKNGRGKVEEIVREGRERLAEVAEGARGTITEFIGKAGELEDRLAEQMRSMSEEMGRECGRRAQETAREVGEVVDRKLEMFRRGVAEVGSIAEEVVREAMGSVHEKAEAVAQVLCEQMEGRVQERLSRRMMQLAPKVMDAAQSAEKMLHERLTAMIEHARGMAALHEGQIMRQVEGIRPRVAAQTRAIEAELAAALARMTEEAEREMACLDHRLTSRVEEQMHEAQRALRGEMGSKVEVEVFVEGKRRVGGAAA